MGCSFSASAGELADLARGAHDLVAGDDGPGADIVPARSGDPVVAKQQLAAMRRARYGHQALIKAKRDELEALMLAELALAGARPLTRAATSGAPRTAEPALAPRLSPPATRASASTRRQPLPGS